MVGLQMHGKVQRVPTAIYTNIGMNFHKEKTGTEYNTKTKRNNDACQGRTEHKLKIKLQQMEYCISLQH
jgi:hypothetical protein